MRYGDNIQREISYTVLSVCVGQACKDALWSGVITGIVKTITSYTFAVCVKGACVCVCVYVYVCVLSQIIALCGLWNGRLMGAAVLTSSIYIKKCTSKKTKKKDFFIVFTKNDFV